MSDQVGDIHVDVVPNPAGFPQRLRAIVSSAASRVKARIDATLDDSNLRRQVSHATRVAGAGQRVPVGVNVEGAGMLGRLRAALRGARGDADRAAGGTGNLKRGILGVASAAIALRAIIATIGFPALVGGISAAIGALGALGAAAVGLTAALGPLVGLLGAVPALLGAVGLGFGVVKGAFSGVGDAVKGFITDQEGAGRAARSSARAVESALRAQEAAAERVREATQSLADARRSAAQQERAAIRAVDDAYEDAARSQIANSRAIRDALRDLTQARADEIEEIEDLRRAAVTNVLDERQALRELAEARRRYNESVAGTGEAATLSAYLARRQLEELGVTIIDNAESYEDAQARQQEALDDVARAEANLADIRDRREDDSRRLTRLETEGSEQVREAEERLADARAEAAQAEIDNAERIALAREALAEAQEEGQRRIAEATRELALAIRDAGRAADDFGEAGAGASSKFGEAMGRLSPAAQAFVHQLLRTREVLLRLRDVAAANLFPGLTAGLAIVTPLLASFEPIVAAVAREIGNFAVQLATFLASPGMSGRIHELLWGLFEIIRILLPAVIPLVDAFVRLTIAAMPLAHWLAQMAVGFAQSLSGAVQTGEATGRLAGFFERTRSVAEQVFAIMDNIIGALGGIFSAAGPLGEWLLGRLVAITEAFDRLTNSASGQNAMRQYFADVQPVLTELGRLTSDIFGGLGQILREVTPQLAPLIAQLRTEFLPVLIELISKIDVEFISALITLATEATNFFVILRENSGMLTTLIELLSGALRVIRFLLTDVPGVSTVLRGLLSAMVALTAVRAVTALFVGFSTALTRLSGIPGLFGLLKVAFTQLAAGATVLAAALGVPVLAIVGVGVAIAGLATLVVIHWDTIKNAIGVAAEFIGGVLGAIAGFLSNMIGNLVNFVTEWGALLLGPIAAMWRFRDEIWGAIQAVMRFLDDLLGNVMGWAGGFVRTIANAVGDVVGSFLSIGGRVIGNIAGFFGDLIGRAIGWAHGFGREVGEGISRVVRFFWEMPGRIFDAIGDLAGRFFQFGIDIVEGLIRGIERVAGRVFSAVRDMAVNAVKGAVDAILPGSPSRVFMRLGMTIPQGLALGIERQTHLVREAARRMADATRFEPFVPDLNAGAPGRGGSSLPDAVGARFRPTAPAGVRTGTGPTGPLNNGPLVLIDVDFNGPTSAAEVERVMRDIARREYAAGLTRVLTMVQSGTGRS